MASIVDFTKLPLHLGSVTASPAAMATLSAANELAISILARHAAGDWGDVDDEERAANWAALGSSNGIVCSVFRLITGTALIIATEMAPRQTSIITVQEA